MTTRITQQLDDAVFVRLLIQAWHLGFSSSTDRCNGEFPEELEDDGTADVRELIQAFQAAFQQSRKPPSIQRIEKLHLWTAGDSSVGIPGESAEVSAPGGLISSEDFAPEDFKSHLEEFRQKAREAFKVLWPDEEVYAQYDFELREENESLA